MKTTIVFPSDTLERLDDLAGAVDVSRSELVTDILNEVLDNRDEVLDDLFGEEEDDKEDEEVSSD